MPGPAGPLQQPLPGGQQAASPVAGAGAALAGTAADAAEQQPGPQQLAGSSQQPGSQQSGAQQLAGATSDA